MEKVPHLTQQGINLAKAELLDIQELHLPKAQEAGDEREIKQFEARIAYLRNLLANCIRIETNTPIAPPPSVEQVWEEFWKPLVCDAEGDVNIEQVKKELCDFHFMIKNVGKVYDHITGGNISKVTADPKLVIQEADDHYSMIHEPEEDEREE